MKEIKLGTIGSGPIVHEILDAVKVTEGISCRLRNETWSHSIRVFHDIMSVIK